MLKTSDNPPIISPSLPLEQIDGTWYVGHTKARFEKAFAWDLHRAGIAYFLPMVERITFSGGRKRKVMMPLFSSYVFFAGDAQARIRAMQTDRLCQVIAAEDQAKLRSELASLEIAMRNKASFDPYPHAVVGRRCRVKNGPFMGVEGTIVQREGLWKLVMQVSMLGQSVAMEVEPGMVEVPA